MSTKSALPPTWLDLYSYRIWVAGMYSDRAASLLAGRNPQEVNVRFRAEKDALFASHSQSALSPEQRQSFKGLSYFPYDPTYCVEALLNPTEEGEGIPFDTGGSNTTLLRRAGTITFTLDDKPLELTLFWIDVYGGGLFLPFRDSTCPPESYGGGRYLFDTVKGSDFQRAPVEQDGRTEQSYRGGRIVLDFNYAYNPSCAYDSRWVCPLAPRENWLPIPIRAGEQKYHE